MRILIKNGLIVDPAAQARRTGDLLVEDRRFVAELSGEPDQVVDATGMAVLPGLIDAHCHLREPGFEYREDIVSGTRSAAAGGFTTVACMPNTKPACDNAAIVRYIKEKSRADGFARVLPIGAVSKGQLGKELAEIGLMAGEGIVAVSDDGRPVESADLMRKAMLYASYFNLRVISHCEDLTLSEDGHMNEGYWSTVLGLRGIPDAAESVMVARECLLAEYLNLPVHIAHVSARSSVEIIRQARRRGVQVTCETCPHYFTLTEAACQGFNTQAKMNPPLRTADDLAAIIEGLRDGTIDLIVTDHAPHHIDEKELEFGLANNGIVGFETAFALGYTTLVRPGLLTLEELLIKMALNPAALFAPELGTLQPGRPADFCLADLESPFIFDKNTMLSKARNTPYHGWNLFGRIRATWQEGRQTYAARS
jgi:dihydroorotase